MSTHDRHVFSIHLVLPSLPCDTITPRDHFSSPSYSHAPTPTRQQKNCLFLACCWCFSCCAPCDLRTSSATLGFRQFSRERSLRPRNNIAGISFVVAWGVLQYVSRNESRRCCTGAVPLETFNACLNVCIKHSARPLVAGWYGAE